MENTQPNDMNTQVAADDPVPPEPNEKKRGSAMSRILQAIVLCAVLALIGTSALFFSQDATAAPSVSWGPTSISETLLAGESRTVTLMVTAQEAVSSATLQVVPELEPYVSVTPMTIGPLAKGETTSLSLSITVPIDAIPYTATGTVHLRKANEPNKTIAQPLPVSVEVRWPEVTFEDGEFSIAYPPSWEASVTERTIHLEGQVTPVVATAPGDLGGICKIGIRSNENPSSLPLKVWIGQTRNEAGAPLPMSSHSIKIAGIDGIEELTEELGITKTIFLASSPTTVMSFQLLCGDEAFSDGEHIFDMVVRTVVFK